MFHAIVTAAADQAGAKKASKAGKEMATIILVACVLVAAAECQSPSEHRGAAAQERVRNHECATDALAGKDLATNILDGWSDQ